MIASEFINKWRGKKDSDGTPLVGIIVNWENIKPDSKVIQLVDEQAWERIYDFTPPWYAREKRLPFRDFIKRRGQEYQSEISMEKGKIERNKFEYIKKHGLTPPLSSRFVAFADLSGSKGALGDGNHRFLAADSLIQSKDIHRAKEIKGVELDIICLQNFNEVIPFDPFV